MVFLQPGAALERAELPSMAIGLFGHLGSGKTTLLTALTHVLADRGWARPLDPDAILRTPTERKLGRGADLRHVDTRTERRRHVWVDCPGRARSVGLAIRGACQVDVGVLVVASDEGPRPQMIEHVLAARHLGVRHWVVFLSKVDACDGDDELLDLSEVETREQLSLCGLDGDAITVLRGSPRRLLQPDVDPATRARERRALLSLVAACDELPLVHHDAEGSPWMSISDTFKIRDLGGVIVAGRIGRGVIARGDEIELIGETRTWKVEVASLERVGVAVERAEAGAFVGVRVIGPRRDEVHAGHVLSAPGGAHTRAAVRAHLRMTASALLSRQRAFFRGFCPTVYAHSARAVGYFAFDEGVEMLLSGDRSSLQTLHLHRPMVLSPGDRFVLRDGTMIVAVGEVLDAPVPEPYPVPEWSHRRGRRWCWRRHFPLRRRS